MDAQIKRVRHNLHEPNNNNNNNNNDTLFSTASFRLVLKVVFFFLGGVGDSPASEFYVLAFRNM